PSATSSGSIPRAWASAGMNNSANNRSSRRSIVTALVRDVDLVEVWTQPPLGAFDGDAAALGVFLELIPADPRYPEILAVAVAEVEAGHRRGWQHREILGQGY